MVWACATYYAETTADPCKGCDATRRTLCHAATSAGLVVLCETPEDPNQLAAARDQYHPRPGRIYNYRTFLRPGETFTAAQLAARANASPAAAKEWCRWAYEHGELVILQERRYPSGARIYQDTRKTP